MYQPYPGSDTKLPETRPALTGTVLFGLATLDTVVGLP